MSKLKTTRQLRALLPNSFLCQIPNTEEAQVAWLAFVEATHGTSHADANDTYIAWEWFRAGYFACKADNHTTPRVPGEEEARA
jgi:hypothetical protein